MCKINYNIITMKDLLHFVLMSFKRDYINEMLRREHKLDIQARQTMNKMGIKG